MGELTPTFVITDNVWRVFGRAPAWSKPFDEWDFDMAEPWSVVRITPLKVFAQNWIDPDNMGRTIVLKRGMLQRSGWTLSRTLTNGGGLFLARLPDAYRRQTLGYLFKSDAWEVLGLKPGAHADDIKRAYRRAIMIAHPDQGGSREAYDRVQAAYDKLCREPGLGALLAFAQQQTAGGSS